MNITLLLLIGIPTLMLLAVVIGTARGEPLITITTYEWVDDDDDPA